MIAKYTSKQSPCEKQSSFEKISIDKYIKKKRVFNKAFNSYLLLKYLTRSYFILKQLTYVKGKPILSLLWIHLLAGFNNKLRCIKFAKIAKGLRP